MSVIEKAGQGVLAAPVKPARRNSLAQSAEFKLDFGSLASQGFYHPEARVSQLAQELRAVKRRLLRRIDFLRAAGDGRAFHSPGRRRNIVMITSARAGEGKTFSAANLALSLAIEDQIDTLLVDADLMRPKVRTHFGLPAGPGLTDAMTSPATELGSCCRRATEASLTILPEGAPVERATELFAGEAARAFWTELSAAWGDGLILIDAPPVLAAAEAVILSKYADEIIFVVEANATPEPAVASAIDELLDVNPNVSLMLNRCLIGSGGSHYGSYESYDRCDGAAEQTAHQRQKRGALHGAE